LEPFSESTVFLTDDRHRSSGLRLRSRDLTSAFEAYETAAREHAFAHAAVTRCIRGGEAPSKRETGAVDRARRKLDGARRALLALLAPGP
jgi:hypothetical protein